MTKKNYSDQYTTEAYTGWLRRLVQVIKDIKEVILVVSAVVMVVLNLIFSYKLAPLVETDQQTSFRVSAIEKDYERVEKQLEVINNKLDKLLLK